MAGPAQPSTTRCAYSSTPCLPPRPSGLVPGSWMVQPILNPGCGYLPEHVGLVRLFPGHLVVEAPQAHQQRRGRGEVSRVRATRVIFLRLGPGAAEVPRHTTPLHRG